MPHNLKTPSEFAAQCQQIVNKILDLSPHTRGLLGVVTVKDYDPDYLDVVVSCENGGEYFLIPDQIESKGIVKIVSEGYKVCDYVQITSGNWEPPDYDMRTLEQSVYLEIAIGKLLTRLADTIVETELVSAAGYTLQGEEGEQRDWYDLMTG